MKKIFKVIATVAAILSMANFVACKSDDDSSDTDSENVVLSGTYWILADEEQTSGNATVKFSNESYIYIKDDSNGTLNQIEEWEFSTSESKTYTSSNYVSTNFTYSVTDSGITITAGEDTATATLAEDGKSITVKMPVDGETIESVYNKADAAPTEATLVVTVSSSTDTTAVLDVVYDLTTGLPSDFPTTDTIVSSDWAAPTADPTTNDITWAWLTTTNRKVKSNSGLQVSNGTGAEDLITLSADSNFTVTITYKFAGAYDAAKVRCLSAGDQSVSMESTTDNSKTYTLTTSAAKSVTIAANGMKITKIATSAAE